MICRSLLQAVLDGAQYEKIKKYIRCLEIMEINDVIGSEFRSGVQRNAKLSGKKRFLKYFGFKMFILLIALHQVKFICTFPHPVIYFTYLST